MRNNFYYSNFMMATFVFGLFSLGMLTGNVIVMIWAMFGFYTNWKVSDRCRSMPNRGSIWSAALRCLFYWIFISILWLVLAFVFSLVL